MFASILDNFISVPRKKQHLSVGHIMDTPESWTCQGIVLCINLESCWNQNEARCQEPSPSCSTWAGICSRTASGTKAAATISARQTCSIFGVSKQPLMP